LNGARDRSNMAAKNKMAIESFKNINLLYPMKFSITHQIYLLENLIDKHIS